MIFGHVGALCEDGVNAVVASADPSPPAWLNSQAPLISLSDIVREEDILVFPENHPGLLTEFASWENKKIVFCQNQFQIFRGLGERQHYADYGVTEIICPSQHAASFCHLRFPDTKTTIIPCYVDQTRFHFDKTKKMQIAFMPRKRQHELHVIRDLFRATHPELKDVPWKQIDGVSEQQVAEILRQSAVYLALNQFESFGLSSLEALASGCLVAGFTGFGSREYATTINGFWADEADVIGAVENLAQAVVLARERWSLYDLMIHSGLSTAQHYSRDTFVRRLRTYWKNLLEEEG